MLLSLAALGADPVAASPRGYSPPTAAELERATDTLLRQPSLRGGGIGEAPEQPEPGADDERLLAPRNLAVALYGAPQLTATAVGKRSPSGAARKLRKQARAYARSTRRPVVRSLNLIGVIATASRGSDGKYRARQPDEIIRRYLKAARSVGARLTLDIQPGRSPVLSELRALKRWISLPDVDVGIDPEWHVGRRGVPGRTEGSISARKLNQASRWINELVTEGGLPPKAMIVHQFRKGSISQRRKINPRASVDVLLNFDGIGSRGPKKAGYAKLAVNDLLDGFSLFYDRDIRLMKPRAVLRLKPRVEYAMYQ